MLICCIALVAWVVMVRGDDSAGGCIFNGGNQSDTNCIGNTNGVAPKPSSASGVGVNLRWLALLCIVLNLGLAVRADNVVSGPVAGCVFSGGTVQGVNCVNNSVNGASPASASTSTPPPDSGNGLSGGAIAGIVLGVLPALAALLAIGAMIIRSDATVEEGQNRTPIRHFKREPGYRIVEGCTLGFGCGALGSLERGMGNWVKSGAKRSGIVEAKIEAPTQPEMTATK